MNSSMQHPEIYLVRHGETEWNCSKRYQGQLDSRLTEKGKIQAASVGHLIKTVFSEDGAMPIYCSPLGRCKQTAKEICNVAAIDPAKTKFEDRLMELHCGHWQTFTRKEVEELWPNEVADYKADIWNYKIPGGGENGPMLQRRARGWLRDVFRAPRIVVISHGMIGRIIRGLCCDLSPEEVLSLKVPQGVVFHLKNGIETILPGIHT
ncbi:MAG: hypothetical protein CMF69_02640 [Magnetovibrio sp.]|nr:hypothetical protein [Magnetovibrio sp.]